MNFRLRVAAIAMLALATAASASGIARAATIEHRTIPYFVPEKRVRLEARIMDPKGVQLARAYFKAGAQADYTYVPMEAASDNRYNATLPAPSASTPSIEYLFLAQNNDGAVARTQPYVVQARKTTDTPAWQSAAGDGELTVYTELPNAPRTVVGFTDSLALDVTESGARLGAAAGLYGAPGGAAGSTAAATSATGTTTAASGGATAGGLSTAAILGGVAAAAGLAAAAGGGGGGSSGGSPPGGTASAYAGAWSGTWSVPMTSTAPSCPPMNCGGTWSGNVDSAGFFVANSVGTCVQGGFPPAGNSNIWSGQVSSTGSASFPLQGGAPGDFGCTGFNAQLSLSPRGVSGSASCAVTVGGPCAYTGTMAVR